MPKRKLPTALAALFALALIGLGVAVAAGGKGYATTISGSYLGGGVFAGAVSTAAAGKIDDKAIRGRCADHRRVESASRDGSVQIRLRTTAKGNWSFSLPEEPGRQIKVFVLSKRLPGGSFCSFAKTTLAFP